MISKHLRRAGRSLYISSYTKLSFSRLPPRSFEPSHLDFPNPSLFTFPSNLYPICNFPCEKIKINAGNFASDFFR
jgi:hypothetical protein